MKYIINPDMSYEDIYKIFDDSYINVYDYEMCSTTQDFIRGEDDGTKFFYQYHEDLDYVNWLETNNILVKIEERKDVGRDWVKDTLGMDQKYQDLKQKYIDLSNDYSQLKQELEDLKQAKSIWEDEKKALNQEVNEWYRKYQEVNNKLGALQNVLNGIRIIIGG